jgi:hypothetical protein
MNQNPTDFEEVVTVPVVSTAYVEERDMELVGLMNDPDNPVSAYSDEFGAWVHLSADDDELAGAMVRFGYSEAFVRIYEEAASCGHAYLRLDHDGSDVTGLEPREW